MYHKSKCKSKMFFLQENIGKNLYDLGLNKKMLDTKSTIHKRKHLINWASLKVKTSLCALVLVGLP